MKGVPLRLEISPRDLQAGLPCWRGGILGKKTVALEELMERIPALEEIQKTCLQRQSNSRRKTRTEQTITKNSSRLLRKNAGCYFLLVWQR